MVALASKYLMLNAKKISQRLQRRKKPLNQLALAFYCRFQNKFLKLNKKFLTPYILISTFYCISKEKNFRKIAKVFKNGGFGAVVKASRPKNLQPYPTPLEAQSLQL